MAQELTNIGGIGVPAEIPHVRFACDLKRCKGACCTMPGGLGAPLLQSEAAEIVKAYPIVSKYLSEEHQEAIGRQGLFELQFGAYTTPCVNHRACVFVTYEEGVAKCAFEKAYFKGEIAWRKPISCHLFPIRVDYGVQESLRYEQIPECEPARERGTSENIFLSDFVKDSLTRAYGETWYQEFAAHAFAQRPPTP